MIPRTSVAPTPLTVVSATALALVNAPPSSPALATMSPLLSPMIIDPAGDPSTSTSTATASIAPLALRIDRKRGKKRVNSEDQATPSSSVLGAESRHIAPLRSSRRINSTPMSSPTPPVHTLPPTISSRESSPVSTDRVVSSPVKRPRTSSISGEIHNFHIFTSDDEADDPTSTVRCRQRFNQLLGPSPLQKSFSSTALPQRAVTPPSSPLERALTSPSADAPVKTRARALLSKMEISSAVEDLGMEMNKVFMLVHGRGMGMGSSGGGRFRRGSALRPKEGGPSSESSLRGFEPYGSGDMSGLCKDRHDGAEKDDHMDYDD